MENADIAIYVTFFWYGFSLVLYLFTFIRRANTVNQEQTNSLRPFQVLLIILLGLVGTFGFAFFAGSHAGNYNKTEENYLSLMFLAGGLIGFLASKILLDTNAESSNKE